MRKTFLKQVITAFVAALLLTATANADFAKTKTYAEGQFTDVVSSEWYASSVKDAYEYGIMQGNSATTFNPIGTLTVAEGVTISARLYETISGNAIKPVTGGEWYKQYVDYCVEQGIFAADKFDSYTRTIRRSEMAELMAAVSGDLAEINTVTGLPDVPYDAEYAKSVFKLYKAGILTGNDATGTFGPESELKRSEISAMAVRIADSSKRKQLNLVESSVRPYYDAYSIIDVEQGNLGRNRLANGWNYDFRFGLIDDTGRDKHYINDSSDNIFGSLKRDFDPEYAGVLKLDTFITVKSQNGCSYLVFQNKKLENVVSLEEKDGKWALIGKETVVSDVEISPTTAALYAVKLTIDLDKNTAYAVINNKVVGTVSINDCEVSRLELGCRKAGTGSVQLEQIHLNKNYSIYERFVVTGTQKGEKPVDWNVTGDFGFQYIKSMLGTDLYSMKAESKAGSVSTATKSFDTTAGKINFEAFVLLPEKVDGASVCLTSAGNDVLKFETKDGKFVMGDTVLLDYTANVWHLLYVEADTRTGKALVKINGKEKATVDFYVPYFDGVKFNFAPDKDAVMWFDDVKVSHLIDHADYPSYPKVAASDDYNVGVNVCWLWRDSNSMEGWDASSPFPEFDPYLGFYDEGLRETADWEIKWMAEHGIDFLHACWYAPQSDMTAPIKQWRVSYSALHDGYMNAKYSDLVDFCIMWETGYKGCSSLEGFYNYLWPYWKEYYFADDRYARLDNKAVFTIWGNGSAAANCVGGEENLKEALQFMDAELKKMGYDGILVLFSTTGSFGTSSYEKIAGYGVDSATYAYHWHEAGASAAYQISCNNGCTKNASTTESHHIPTVSVGFNDVARNESRAEVVSFEGHLSVCEDMKKILAASNTGTWRDNTVMVSTWNEYSEGTYVFPVEQCGFNYLENIRKAFTNDTSDHSEVDVKPTTAQIDRVGHLYPPNHAPIRWLQLEGALTGSLSGGANVVIPSELDIIKRFDLKTEFKVSHNITGAKQDTNLFSGTGIAADFGIQTTIMQPVSTERATVLHIKMKSGKVASGEVFFKTDADPNYDGKKMKNFAQSETGADENGYVDYYVKMDTVTGWNGNIIGLRIDPCTSATDFEIVLIELLGDAEAEVAKDAVVVVNNKKLSFTFAPVFDENGDIVAVGEARKGFYSMLGLYHEYDRFTGDGVIKLYTRDNKELVFTVGSDKVLVNGVEQELGYTFVLRDGLPVFRLKKLLEFVGYKYTVEDNTISIQACSDEEYAEIMNRKPNHFEFNIEGDIESFTCQHTSISQANGRLVGAAGTTIADPAVMRSVSFSADDYGSCVVGMLYTPLLEKHTPQLFFTNSTGFSGDKCVNGTYDLTGKGEGDIVEITFDLRSNAKYVGTIKNIRFDPFASKTEFEIDYIRFIESKLTDEIEEKYNLYKKIDLKKELSIRAITVAEQTSDFIQGISTTSDPALTLMIPEFSAKDVRVLAVTMRATTDTNMQVYFITDTDSAWNESKGTSQLVKASDATKTFYINIGANSNWKGTIKSLRVDPVSHNGTSFAVESIELLSANGSTADVTENTESTEDSATLQGEAKKEETKTVDFSGYTLTKFDIAKNFVQNDGFTTYKATGESFTGLSKHQDPMIQTKAPLATPIVAANTPYVVAKMKADKDSYARIYFITETSKAWSEDKGISVTVKASDEPVEVVFDMSKVATWNGNVTQIRLDPVGVKECNIEVEYFGVYTK